MSKQTKTILIIFNILVLLFLLIQTYNKAYRDFGNDFTNYLDSAEILYEGEDPRDEIWPYLYFLPFIFTPFLCIPKWLAIFLWFACNAAALVWVFEFCKDTYFGEKNTIPPPYSLIIQTGIFLLLLPIIQNDFLNGQINIIILALVLLFLRQEHQNHCVPASLCLSLAILLKLVPSIFFAYLLVRQQWRLIALTFFWILLGCLLPVVFLGFELFSYYSDYFHYLIYDRLAYQTDITHSIFLSFEDALSYLFTTQSQAWVTWPVNFTWLGLVIALDTWQRTKKTLMGDCWMTALYLLSILLISPLSETHHLILCIPAVLWLALQSVSPCHPFRKSNTASIGIYFILFYLGKFEKTGPFLFFSVVVLCLSVISNLMISVQNSPQNE